MLDELQLIQPVEINADLGDGKSYNFPGLFTIGVEQFQSLSGDSLTRLNRAGYLASAIFIRSSLQNLNHLIDRKKRALANA
jgi:hypothetical protein